MTTIRVKTTTVRENGESVYQARIYRGNRHETTVNLRGGGYSSKSAYDQAISTLRNRVAEMVGDGDTLKVDRALMGDLGLVAEAI